MLEVQNLWWGGMFWSVQLLVMKISLGLIVIVFCHLYPLSTMEVTFTAVTVTLIRVIITCL
jgi:cytochrome c oxidase subunit IV